MADLSLDLSPALLGSPAYGDLKLTDGDLTLTDDVDPRGTHTVAQLITQRLRFFLGSWFLNTDEGVPYYQQILVRDPDPATVDGLLRECILGTPGVAALQSYDSRTDRARRTMTVRFVVTAADGRTLTGQVPIATST